MERLILSVTIVIQDQYPLKPGLRQN